jgi:hypothetical protein
VSLVTTVLLPPVKLEAENSVVVGYVTPVAESHKNAPRIVPLPPITNDATDAELVATDGLAAVAAANVQAFLFPV